MTGIKKVGEVLIDFGFVTEEQLQAALLHQKKTDPKKKIGEILVELGFLNELDLLKCLAGLFKVRHISSEKLLKMSIPQWILDLIPLDFAQKNNVLPFFCYDKAKILSVVIADPQDKQLPKQIKNVSGYYEIERYIALESTIKAGIAKFYNKEAAPFEQLKTVIKPENPQTIASFVPKNDTILNDTVFGDSEKPVLKPKGTHPPATEDDQQRRLSDHIIPLSVMSDDTFIEVLNVVINVLEIYKSTDPNLSNMMKMKNKAAMWGCNLGLGAAGLMWSQHLVWLQQEQALLLVLAG